ncbi:MAG TPA: flagellar hook capping FlgD N-terminal domain-containing protein [Burkholderiales bacterium]
MAVESIGAVAQNPVTNLQNAGLGQEDFLKILLTQLSFQDPLKPLDNEQFVAQIAQFSALELNRQANDKVDALLTFQSATQALGLIGKTVEVNSSTGSQVGNVTTVTFNGGSPSLTVQTSDGAFLTGISLSQVFVVR